MEDASAFLVEDVDAVGPARMDELESLRRGFAGPREVVEKRSAAAIGHKEVRKEIAGGMGQQRLLHDMIEEGVQRGSLVDG